VRIGVSDLPEIIEDLELPVRDDSLCPARPEELFKPVLRGAIVPGSVKKARASSTVER
jgi:hypothetical protein